MPIKEFLDAINLLTGNTHFQYGGNFYKQVYASPMDSPVSPRFADLVMDDHESECIIKLDLSPLLYARYVCDIFMIIPRDKIEHTLEVYNS